MSRAVQLTINAANLEKKSILSPNTVINNIAKCMVIEPFTVISGGCLNKQVNCINIPIMQFPWIARLAVCIGVIFLFSPPPKKSHFSKVSVKSVSLRTQSTSGSHVAMSVVCACV